MVFHYNQEDFSVFIDLHIHEMNYSKDSYLSLEEIVTIAKQHGLGGVQ